MYVFPASPHRTRAVILTVFQMSSFTQQGFPRDHDKLYDRKGKHVAYYRHGGELYVSGTRGSIAVLSFSGLWGNLHWFPERWAGQCHESWARFVLNSTLSAEDRAQIYFFPSTEPNFEQQLDQFLQYREQATHQRSADSRYVRGPTYHLGLPYHLGLLG